MRIKTDIITKTARQYRSQSLWVLCTLTIIGLLYIQIQGRFELINSLIISILFNLFCSIAYGQTWKAIARRSPETLPKFYLAWSAMRLMAAAIAHLLRNCTGDSSDKVVCRDFHCLLYRDVSI